jgi:acetylornithine deacetylase
MQTAAEILRTLVAVPSVSSMSNGPLLDAIEVFLAMPGWHAQRLSYIAADGLEKANLLAVPHRFLDRLPQVELLFVCHTDTVPFHGEWTEATQLREQEGQLHGCGSCDVKGSLSGLLSAAQQVDVEAMPVPVAYAFTAEEEIGCIGATRLVASGAIRPRRVVVCEPTSLRPAIAGKGYGLAEVRVTGREAHSAFPEKGVSAISLAAQIIVKLEQWQETTERVCDNLFSPPYTTFNVGVVGGGTAKNIVAGECSFLVEWRPVPGEDPRYGGQMVQQLAAEVANAHPQCRIEVRVLRADAGFAKHSASRLGSVLSHMLGRPETGISFGSEATRFATLAEEAVVIGPGDMETAHSERECVPLSELEEWTETVKSLLLHGLSEE